MGIDATAELMGAGPLDVVEALRAHGELPDIERHMAKFDADGHGFVVLRTEPASDDRKGLVLYDRVGVFLFDLVRYGEPAPPGVRLRLTLSATFERRTGLLKALCERFGGWYRPSDARDEPEAVYVEPSPSSDGPRDPVAEAANTVSDLPFVGAADVLRLSALGPEDLRSYARALDTLADAMDAPAPTTTPGP